MFVDIKTKEVFDIFQLKQRHRNICFPDAIDEESLKQLGYGVIKQRPMLLDIDTLTQKIEISGVECVNGEWFHVYSIVELPLEQQVQNHNNGVKDKIAVLEATITVRRIRDAILTEQGKIWLEDIHSKIDKLRTEFI